MLEQTLVKPDEDKVAPAEMSAHNKTLQLQQALLLAAPIFKAENIRKTRTVRNSLQIEVKGREIAAQPQRKFYFAVCPPGSAADMRSLCSAG